MNLTQAQAFVGLRASATPTGTNVSNDVQIGVGNTVIPLTGAEVAYSVGCLMVGSSADFVIDLVDNDTTGTTSWTAGAAQVETATAAGTVTVAGNAAVVVTSTGMAGSPLTLNVAVALNDTAAQWAAKVRTALAANSVIASRFDVSGSSASIVLTRKPSKAYTLGTTSIPLHVADDATLNISLDNGTCTGIATAATSANTTAGVATAGCLLYDGEGKDFEGITLPAIGGLLGFLIQNSTASESGFEISGAEYNAETVVAGQFILTAGTGSATISPDTLTLSPTTSAFVAITVIGQE
jgi:hypothetical protein